MATCSVEHDMLNETSTSLQSTSKGQLGYDPHWNIKSDTSAELSFSLESFLSESADSLNASITAICLEQYSSPFDNESDKNLEKENYDEEATIGVSGLARNFESENQLNIREFEKGQRRDADLRTAEWARIIERRRENLKKHTYGQEDRANERKKFDDEIAEKERQNLLDLQKLKIALEKEAVEKQRKLDGIFIHALNEESHMTSLENLKKNIITLCQQVIKNIEVTEENFNNPNLMSFVEGQVYENIEMALTGLSAKAVAVEGRCKALKDLQTAEEYLEATNKLLQATLAVDQKVIAVLKLAAEKKKKLEEAEKIKTEEEKLEKAKQEKVKQEKARQEMDKKSLEQSSELKTIEKPPAAKSQTSNPEISEMKFVQYISENALTEYAKLQEHLDKVQASFKPFAADPQQTKYKFDLQKAINIPINALSAHSPSQLNDKVYRLVTLLSGENVEVGGKRFNCRSHPQALMFCKHLVAKKLVMQGAQQVSSNPSSAFLYAAVIVGIWSAFPDVGELILAHFYRSYPYLVPYYMPQVEGQTKNDYYKALGYSIINDKIEDENHFLKKFSGTVQLYAAVVSSKGATTPDHPHGIDKGWTWLARTLNLKPHPSVTATMIFEFIKVAGHLLMRRYRKQFQKLLAMLIKNIIPAIEKVTPPEKQGPTQRLKDFLEECIKSQSIEVPKGYLTERWWQSGQF